jgi:hypothetical protein
VPLSEYASEFLGSLAAQDFAQLGGTLAADARMCALLPVGVGKWTGAEAIAGRFAGWFGGTEDFECVESAATTVADRLHLRWQLRLRAERLGVGWFIVEQQAYADTDTDGRLARLDVLCTGYRPDGDND